MNILKFYNNFFSNKYVSFFITLFILTLCSLPSENVPLSSGISDKYAHFIAFGTWAFCWQFAFGHYWQSLCIGLLYGVFIEFWQEQLPGSFHRSFDWYDALADGIGLGMGLITFKIQNMIIDNLKGDKEQ